MSYRQNTRTTSSFSKPVETGKEYIVDVTDNGREGDGIAKAGDKNIKIKINSVGSRFATAEVVSGTT